MNRVFILYLYYNKLQFLSMCLRTEYNNQIHQFIKIFGPKREVTCCQREMLYHTLCAGVQQYGASVSARGEEDSSSHQTQPQRGGRGSYRQPEWTQVQRSILAGGISRDVSSSPPWTKPPWSLVEFISCLLKMCLFIL